jgi:hypothetical protein
VLQVVAEGCISKEIGRRSPATGPLDCVQHSRQLILGPQSSPGGYYFSFAASRNGARNSDIGGNVGTADQLSNSGDIDGRCGRSFTEAQPKWSHHRREIDQKPPV